MSGKVESTAVQDQPAGQSSVWFFYFVAATLGISFLLTLLVLAWNNVVEREVQKFAYESLSIDDTVSTNVRATHDAIENFGSVLKSIPNISSTQLAAYTDDLLNRFVVISAIGVYHQVSEGQFVKRHTRVRDQETELLPDSVSLSDADPVASGFAGAISDQAPVPTAAIGRGDDENYFMLVNALRGDSGRTEVVVFAIDPRDLFGSVAAHAYMTVRLFSESEGIGGRQLLFERTPPESRGRWAIKTLEESTQVRLDRYSMRLNAARQTYWADLEKGLLFTGLVLGAGVTLLLVALARAKELQARELRERNRVIEEQVQRQTKELAQARDQALEASRVKSDFLASMSHEIRTPLNAIIGMAELLSDTNLSGDQQKYVGVFKNAGEALLSLVNDILDLSKIEAEQLVLEKIDFNVNAIVEQSADIYALKTASKGIELAAHISPEVPEHVVGDPSRLRQIILNLIGNAIKFTEQGEIIIRVGMAEGDDSAGRLLFSVSDTGIGIPAEKLDSIFGSFTQVDSSTTRKYGGTGLGLTISKKLVEMMDGRIWVESVEGEGSVFKFEISAPAGEAPHIQSVPVDVRLDDIRVLVVDDSETNRLILRESLQAAGASVTECATGREAVEFFSVGISSERPFQLVLCDVQMPGMDGFDVIDKIVGQGASVKTIMMLTSSNLAEDLERAQRTGLGGYLVKPVKRTELMRAIATALELKVEPKKLEASLDTLDSGRRRSVLLVEDNPDNRLLIKAYLKKEPYDVDEAENGQEALEKFQENRYDLVLMDVQMPIMDGHEATRAIRAYEQTHSSPQTPVIALTAHAIKEDMDKSIAAGCSAHLTKPIKKQTLLAALDEHLAGS